MKAIEAVTKEGKHMPKDLGGSADTNQVTEAVCETLKRMY